MLHLRALTRKTHRESQLLNIYWHVTDLNAFHEYRFLDNALAPWHPWTTLKNNKKLNIEMKLENYQTANL